MNTSRNNRQLNYKWIFLFVSSILCNLAWAEKADSAMPMNAQADAMRHDDQKLITTFTGSVVITKGSIVMRGAKIEVRQDAQGNQFATITGDGKKQAFFRQKREGINEFIEGTSDIIDYDGKADNVKLRNEANLKRFAGTTLVDDLKGSLITYENTTERYFVDSGKSNVSPTNPTGRVQAVIGAKSNVASTPVITSSSASESSAPLKTSKTLGSKVK